MRVKKKVEKYHCSAVSTSDTSVHHCPPVPSGRDARRRASDHPFCSRIERSLRRPEIDYSSFERRLRAVEMLALNMRTSSSVSSAKGTSDAGFTYSRLAMMLNPSFTIPSRSTTRALDALAERTIGRVASRATSFRKWWTMLNNGGHWCHC